MSSSVAATEISSARSGRPQSEEAALPTRPPLTHTDRRSYLAAKRVLDIVLSAVFITLTSPVMLAIAVAIKLESRGPVLFGHERLGKDGRLFRCLKFRSMTREAHQELLRNPLLRRVYEENDFKIPLDKDPRVTRVGRFLRKTSLDELPQLFNVLAGAMSLVGPRPIVVEELRWYEDRESLLLSVKPGITGEWQIQGRSRINYPDRADVELESIARRSFGRDIRILALSIPAVLTAEGSL